MDPKRTPQDTAELIGASHFQPAVRVALFQTLIDILSLEERSDQLRRPVRPQEGA